MFELSNLKAFLVIFSCKRWQRGVRIDFSSTNLLWLTKSQRMLDNSVWGDRFYWTIHLSDIYIQMWCPLGVECASLWGFLTTMPWYLVKHAHFHFNKDNYHSYNLMHWKPQHDQNVNTVITREKPCLAGCFFNSSICLKGFFTRWKNPRKQCSYVWCGDWAQQHHLYK